MFYFITSIKNVFYINSIVISVCVLNIINTAKIIKIQGYKLDCTQ